ncbi:hypothetical protein VTK26DRAFT_3834 [Humicola hyalothermophila]
MARRNILLCFDAFGTLFTPKRPVPEQYMAVARQCGLDGFSLDQLHASFKAAFKKELEAHPNYGKSSGMGAEKWWTNVINGAFRPLVSASMDKELPPELAPRLLQRFSSDEGYALIPGVTPLLRSLRAHPYRFIVGVITNSDDRVPGVLSSLGLRVSPLRIRERAEAIPTAYSADGKRRYDIDFHCMSYDVGFAKPDRRIFDAAKAAAEKLVAGQESEGASEGPWTKIYVGDDFDKDVKGARDAGWNAVFVGSDTEIRDPAAKLMEKLGEAESASLEDLFPVGRSEAPLMIQADSVQMFMRWLVKQQI